jgi:hypothetical protein
LPLGGAAKPAIEPPIQLPALAQSFRKSLYTMGLMLSLARVLSVTLGIFAHHPLGVLWVTFVALLFSFVSFGILIGPMQVGFNAVMLRYLRRGEWAPELLWQQFRREAFLAGWVYLALLLVGLVVPLPLERFSPAVAELLRFAANTVLGLLWFYPFQYLAEQHGSWTWAVREGWHLILRAGVPRHVLLVLLLQLINYVPTGTSLPLLDLFVLVLLVGISGLIGVVAYVQLNPQPQGNTPDGRG